MRTKLALLELTWRKFACIQDLMSVSQWDWLWWERITWNVSLDVGVERHTRHGSGPTWFWGHGSVQVGYNRENNKVHYVSDFI